MLVNLRSATCVFPLPGLTLRASSVGLSLRRKPPLLEGRSEMEDRESDQGSHVVAQARAAQSCATPSPG